MKPGEDHYLATADCAFYIFWVSMLHGTIIEV